MTNLQFQDIFRDEIEGLWPQWKPSNSAREMWWEAMKYHEPFVATAMIREHKGSARAINAEPKLFEVKKLLYGRKNEKSRAAPKIKTLYTYAKCVEAPQDRPELENYLLPVNVYGVGVDVPGTAQDRLSVTCNKLMEDNGGVWTGVQSDNTLIFDDGKIGPEAAKQARKRMETGPKTAGQRYLASGKKLTEVLDDHIIKLPPRGVCPFCRGK